MIDQETFFAWLDGELSPDEAADIERQVAGDPDLQRQAANHHALIAGLRSAFAPVAEAPLPPHLAETLAPSTGRDIVDFAEARARRATRSAPPLWRQAAAMAATLAFGVIVGSQIVPDAAGPVQAHEGRLVASAELKSALNARLASAPSDSGARIGMTFRDKSGTICRTFEDQAASGLACRDDRDWRVLGLFPAPEGQLTDYRMAAGPHPGLLSLVDERIAGDPLDAAQEKDARDREWR